MKLLLLILCLIFSSKVKCYEESSSEVFKDALTCYDSSKDDDDDLQTVDAYDENVIYTAKNKDDQAKDEKDQDKGLNCFGLGRRFTRLMELYLKQDSNGTKAPRVIFYSTSRSQPDRVIMRHGDLFLLEKIDFDITRRTIFIVHGFFSHGNDEWIIEMEKALLKWDNVNIFVVDWSIGANTWNYFKAAINTKTVGDQIATFIGQIVNQSIQWHGPNVENWGPLHLIGHSLGAHICGYASHQLRQRNSKWRVQRITGLDPAQPCFKHTNLDLRLDQSDAEFVDVIHTNSRILTKLGLGLPYPLGHVDFYPNGGSSQPGCKLIKSSIWKYIPLPIEKIKKTVCSHGRAYVYLTESINSAAEKNCTFWAHEWDLSYLGIEKILSQQCNETGGDNKCIEMGINSENYNYAGTYFTVTGTASPFCYADRDSIEQVKKFIQKLKNKFPNKIIFNSLSSNSIN